MGKWLNSSLLGVIWIHKLNLRCQKIHLKLDGLRVMDSLSGSFISVNRYLTSWGVSEKPTNSCGIDDGIHRLAGNDPALGTCAVGIGATALSASLGNQYRWQVGRAPAGALEVVLDRRYPDDDPQIFQGSQARPLTTKQTQGWKWGLVDEHGGSKHLAQDLHRFSIKWRKRSSTKMVTGRFSNGCCELREGRGRRWIFGDIISSDGLNHTRNAVTN
jgi:hypothetical protein